MFIIWDSLMIGKKILYGRHKRITFFLTFAKDLKLLKL